MFNKTVTSLFAALFAIALMLPTSSSAQDLGLGVGTSINASEGSDVFGLGVESVYLSENWGVNASLYHTEQDEAVARDLSTTEVMAGPSLRAGELSGADAFVSAEMGTSLNASQNSFDTTPVVGASVGLVGDDSPVYLDLGVRYSFPTETVGRSTKFTGAVGVTL